MRPLRPRSRISRLSASRSVLGLLLLLLPALAAAQEPRPLDHEDYDRWNAIQEQALSPDGRWLSFRVVPRDGEPALHLRNLDSDEESVVARGGEARFTRDSRFLVYRITPEERDDVNGPTGNRSDRGASAPDSLGVLDLSSGTHRHRAGIKDFHLADEADRWVLVHLAEEDDAGDEAGDSNDDEREVGTGLVWWNLITDEERTFAHVLDVRSSLDGSGIVFVRSSPAGSGDGVFFVPDPAAEPHQVLQATGVVEHLTVDDGWTQVAFLSNHESREEDEPEPHLLVAELGNGAIARTVARPGTPGIPEGWRLSDRADLEFSDSGARLYFGTAPRPDPEPEEKDELLENVRLDVWSWHDDFLQSHQLVDLNQERNRSYRAVAHLAGDRVVQLEDPSLLSVNVAGGGDADYALGQDDAPYRPRVSWDTRYVDLYRVDVRTGERELLAEDIRNGGSISPEGRWVFWWDGVERGWQVMDPSTRERASATDALPHPVFNELDDRPAPPGSYGLAGWTEGDERMVVHDAYDLWSVDPSGVSPPVNLTQGYGRENDLRLRISWLGETDRTIRTDEDVLLTAFHQTTKQDGFYRTRLGGDTPPRRLTLDDVSYSNPTRAEEGGRYLFTKRTFRDFPDLWVSDEDFGGQRRVSDANPQQADYRWGTAELVRWTSTDGEELQGLLYKPDDFDPAREWPMMVYFYERSSNSLHNYYAPGAGTSINRTFYVSRGYLLFVPDIPYKPGYPGESAMNAVVPGVLSLVEEGFVDRERIGVQGHSWGGYQIAYMLTRTNLFAAAEAGAPVTNMTSAYGGIRWASGRVRQMQYEQGQSRIGASLWEAQHRYIENSPLFTAYKVETPLLMLHNDEDGAVPWEEGIQFFVALRRLDRPVWLLNYNGEAHGLRQSHNQRDFTIRMQQFFDHYLLGERPPVWMVEGVPALAKGRTLGLELVPDPAVSDDGNDGNDRNDRDGGGTGGR